MDALVDPAPTKTIDQIVAEYIQFRDLLQDLDKRHDEKRAPLVEAQEKLTGVMQEYLDQLGADSIKTPDGTCYSKVKYSASLADPQAFMDYVIKNGAFDLLDRKANVTAVKGFVEEHGTLPPGTSLSAIKGVNVRRPTK